jgi:hypothetical protein
VYGGWGPQQGVKAVSVHNMKAYGEARTQLHSFLTSGLDDRE